MDDLLLYAAQAAAAQIGETLPAEIVIQPAYRYIVTIEGVANATGQAKYCYPSVPSYATAAYNAGLAEPPSGSSSRWEIERHKITVGSFRLIFRPGVGPIEFMQTRPRPLTETTEELDTSETAVDHAVTNAQAGLAVDGVYYIDRETLKATAVTAGSQTLDNVTRGYGGSTAAAHALHADLFASPPTLVGRLVTVYEVPGTATSSSAESVILRGYIAGPPASGLHWTTIECVERFERGMLNDRPVGHWWGWRTDANGDVVVELMGPTTSESAVQPIGGATAGGYWYMPDPGVVVEGAFDATTGQWTRTGRLASGGITLETLPEFLDAPLAYLILFADESYEFASFGYIPDGGSFTASDNPAVIALNLLLSLDGSNVTASATSYDLGATAADTPGGLYPAFSLGVPVAQVDVAAFELAAEVDLADVHARRFWLGGNRPETVADALYRLLAPWGFAAGTTRDGVWTLLRLGDVYPSDSLVTLNSQHIEWGRIAEVRMQTLGRALDRVVLECNPSPEGESTVPQTVEEVGGRSYYPPHTGAEERFRNCPYDANDFAIGADGTTRSHVYNLIANRVRRLADQVAIVRVPLNATKFADVDLGTPVSIHDVSLRDPTTGIRLAVGADGLKGLCTHVDVDWRTRTSLVTIALTDTPKVATMSPSAKVVSYDAGPPIVVTVEEHEVTAADADTDAERFEVDDQCVLVDSRFVLRSSLAQDPAEIDAITSTTLQMHNTFKDAGGSAVTPAAGDWVVYAPYDTCTAGQQEDHGFDADGGSAAAGNQPPGLGANDDAPYRIGD